MDDIYYSYVARKEKLPNVCKIHFSFFISLYNIVCGNILPDTAFVNTDGLLTLETIQTEKSGSCHNCGSTVPVCLTAGFF